MYNYLFKNIPIRSRRNLERDFFSKGSRKKGKRKEKEEEIKKEKENENSNEPSVSWPDVQVSGELGLDFVNACRS